MLKRLLGDNDLVGGGAGADVAGAQFAGQRLAGLIRIGEHRVKPIASWRWPPQVLLREASRSS